MNYFSEHKKGLWGTIIVHIIVLIILVLFGFITPLPLPGEEGILINFGTSKAGSGRNEPAPAPPARQTAAQSASRTTEENKEAVQPPASQAKTAPSQTKTTPSQAQPAPTTPPQQAKTAPATKTKQEEALTQDYEKTAAIETARKKEQEEKKRAEDIEKQRIANEQKKKKEDLEKQRIQAEQKKREEDAERQRIADEQQKEKERLAEAQRKEQERQAEIAMKKQEEERQRKEAEQKQIAEINSRAANAFGPGGSGTSGTSGGSGNETSASASQGVTYPAGNQGNPQGSAESDNYANGANGKGKSGSGPSFSLAGRNALSLPKPDYPGNEEGVVVVSVTVDNNGNVTNAEAGVQGSNTYNSSLLDAAKKAALKARFNAAPNAPTLQKGTITYRFILE